MCMRMQPCDAAWPIDQSSDVPWMPAPSQKPIQRDLIGSSGPGGMTRPARSPAHALFGTCHDGLICLSLMSYRPAGVSSPDCPTAIPYVFTSFRCLYRRKVNVSRLTSRYVSYFFGSV